MRCPRRSSTASFSLRCRRHRRGAVGGRRGCWARRSDLTSGCISDVLRRNGLKPHLVRTYKVSRDPEFAAKVSDVVGLYLNPPEHAVVLSVDEKTSIQALERTQLPLPLRSGRAARHTHDYKRHGVVDLYAALEIATGNVTHRVTESHTGDGLPRVHEERRAALSEAGAARRARQLVAARERRRSRRGSQQTRRCTSTTRRRARPG